MPSSSGVYTIQGGFDSDNLLNQLPDEELSRNNPKGGNPLRTRFINVNPTDNGVSCTVVFELPEKRSGWESVKYVNERYQAHVRFTGQIQNGSVVVISKKENQPEVAS